MDLLEAVHRCPYLMSPAVLARHDTNGKWEMRPHHSAMNRKLIDVGFGAIQRLGLHMPFQVGKTLLSSIYFSAWHLLLQPYKRIILCSHSERYSGLIGSRVRNIIDRYGGPHGVKLRQDSKAKNEWNIISGNGGGFDGGMVCKGFKGDVNGRACDLLLFDDVIKNAEQAMSPIISEGQWDFYCSVAYGRLGPDAPIVFNTTRWGPRDLPGRVYKDARETGETWDVLNFPAIAKEHDPLGRKIGEPLWAEKRSLAQLEKIRKTSGKWFDINYQQDCKEYEGNHFHPQDAKGNVRWPVYVDTGDALVIVRENMARRVIRKVEFTIMVIVDWATSEKATSDFTAVGVFGLTADGLLFVLEMIDERVPEGRFVSHLAKVCRKWRPQMVGIEQAQFSTYLSNEMRRYREIPEPQWLKHQNKSKLLRALPAIGLGENGKIILPKRVFMPGEPDLYPWLGDYIDQLSIFTGIDDEHDDMVDVTSYGGKMAIELRPTASQWQEDPMLLTAGKIDGWKVQPGEVRS